MPRRALSPSRSSRPAIRGGTRRAGAAPEPDVRKALDAFRHIVQALRGGREGGQRTGLSSAQLFALQQIGDHPNASVNEIAALTFTHQSSVSVVIQRLVRRRLVAKVPSSDDRRRHRLALTVKGRRLLRRAPTAVQEHLIAAIAALPAADRRVLARALGEIARLVTPHDAAPHPPMFFEN
jgi:DNA-binding MarR family transcriptional regulator